MTDDDLLALEQLLSPAVAEDLGDRLPTTAIVIIESVGEAGPSLDFFVSEGTGTWQALGMLMSTLHRLEEADARGWDLE